MGLSRCKWMVRKWKKKMKIENGCQADICDFGQLFISTLHVCLDTCINFAWTVFQGIDIVAQVAKVNW